MFSRVTLFPTVLVAFLIANAALAQEGHGIGPAETEQGERLFFTNCANCHGSEGDAIPGVALFSGHFSHGSTDEELIKIIRNGIPGTPMPPSNYSDFQATFIVAYLRSMANLTPTILTKSNPGDPARGRRIFEEAGKCLECHRVNGVGSFLGPDLSEIGGTRRSVGLERSLLDPSAEIRGENHTVMLATQDGARVMARLLNQDTYSLQVIEKDGSLVSFDKAALRSFEIMNTSPMPSYSGKLSTPQLADLISYLTSLKRSKR